eukprot:jgi/Psemu1/252945/estExt_Genewise1Plus.C_580111
MPRSKLVEAIEYYEINKKFDTSLSRKKQTLPPGLGKGEGESETVHSNKRIRKSAKTKGTPPKKAKITKPKFARQEPVPTWEGSPDEKIDGGWPTGWVKRLYARKTGATKGATDRYWYSPKEKIKLRSLVQVKKFMRALEDTNGDEIKAKKNMSKY